MLVTGAIGFLPGDIEEAGELGGLRHSRVFAGYAGWGAGQLEDELEEGSWIVDPATTADVFTDAPAGLWSAVLKRKGGTFAVIALMPDDPRLN